MSQRSSRSKDTNPVENETPPNHHNKKSRFLSILRDTATGNIIAIIGIIITVMIAIISMSPSIINSDPSSTTETLVLFRDQYAITLYIPQGVNFNATEFAWGIPNDTPTRLSMYSAFNLITSEQATCLRLEYENNLSLPSLCEQATIYTNPIASADMFWYNEGLNRLFDITFFYKDELFLTCPLSQTECEIPLN